VSFSKPWKCKTCGTILGNANEKTLTFPILVLDNRNNTVVSVVSVITKFRYFCYSCGTPRTWYPLSENRETRIVLDKIPRVK
jgi:hypothetical protein